MPLLYWKRCPSPWGSLRLLATESGLGYVALPGDGEVDRWVERHLMGYEPVEGGVVIQAAIEQLQQYFAGERQELNIPLDIRGTPFQKEVWQALCEIPYGETRSYAEVAVAIGRPGAARAVGAANGANPLAIVIPCHRVIRADGSLGGYGGGVDLKRALLRLEGGT